ncbi:MAG: hypothetical protein ACM34E_16660 [Acidobacteriota bacterium]
MADVAIASPESEHEVSRAAGPCAMVLFGAAGDLTKRKLVPALFNLAKAKLLPQGFALIGVSVDDLSLEQFRDQVTGFLPGQDRNSETLRWFTERLHYERGDFADPATYSTLMARLANLDSERHTGGNYLFYLATAPKFFAPVVQHLGTAALSREENGQWRRVVIEKPFWTRPGICQDPEQSSHLRSHPQETSGQVCVP